MSRVRAWMTRTWRVWDGYWFRQAPLANLAICRILFTGLQLIMLLTGIPRGLRRLPGLPDDLYHPLFAMQVLTAPFGMDGPPPPNLLFIVYPATLVFGLLAMAGWLTNASLTIFMILNLFLQAWLYSFGEFHHPEAALIIALAILSLSPSGRVLSIDAWLRRQRDAREGRRAAPWWTETSIYASWPLLLIMWILGLIYLSAANAKAVVGGLDWLKGDTLQWYLIRDGLRWDAPLGVWIGQFHPVALLLTWVTMWFEWTFFLVALMPRVRWFYVLAGIALHGGIYVTMKAPFFTFIVLYAVCVPWASWIARVRGRAA